jgi:hypothetical protein
MHLRILYIESSSFQSLLQNLNLDSCICGKLIQVDNSKKEIGSKKLVRPKETITNKEGKNQIRKIVFKSSICTIYLDKSMISTSADGAF